MQGQKTANAFLYLNRVTPFSEELKYDGFRCINSAKIGIKSQREAGYYNIIHVNHLHDVCTLQNNAKYEDLPVSSSIRKSFAVDLNRDYSVYSGKVKYCD